MKKFKEEESELEVLLQDLQRLSTKYEQLRIDLPDTDRSRKIEYSFLDLIEEIQGLCDEI